MESAREVLARPSSGKRKTAKFSNEFLGIIQKILAKFCKTYGGTLDEELAIIWRDSLRDLTVEAIKIGAVETLRVHENFMPTPAQFRTYMNNALSRIGEHSRQAHEDCELCRGTGWKLVPREDGAGNVAVKCDGKSA